ncbi:MAG TPA: CopG family transcriptional regulator [Lentisphaeria bacterium]|nr:MAG: CopG family transcriptional regulator [Lentisphaerae bacterium GWF2_50_93]HCE44260.1 CopG family transcriptional regulator [Lentisphaeria bacterium]
MKAKDLDKLFDEGKGITKHLDLTKARRPEQDQKRVNVDFPVWMIHSLDREARRIGVPRQSIIKLWVSERLEEAAIK